MLGGVSNLDNAARCWLSEPRLRTYLGVCDANLSKAMKLYLWNVGLAQAILHDVALFEVALRNAYDRCLCSCWSGDWLLDAGSPVRRPIMRTNRRGNSRDQNRINRKTIDALANGGRSHDWIVSNLTLGFWAHMTDRSHERDLWIPYLHRVWPKGTSRSVVSQSMSTVNVVRNRAMHHEHLFNPARAELSPMLASKYMEAMYRDLVPNEFLDAYPECFPFEISSFVNGHPAPALVNL